MFPTLDVHRSGFYAWLKQPLNNRASEDKRLLGLIKQSWQENGFAYGYCNITKDLKDWGEKALPNSNAGVLSKAVFMILDVSVNWKI